MVNQSIALPLAEQSPILDIVGLHGGAWFGLQAAAALRQADLIIGAQRLHDDLDSTTSAREEERLEAERLDLFGPLDQVIDLIEERIHLGQRVCMLASGDPGFFGIERMMVGRFGHVVQVHPAPSSVALAFARARIHWDDATIVSCHGRPLERALPHILAASKVAVLVSKTTPPEAIGQALLDAPRTHGQEAPYHFAVVCSHLGDQDESITRTDLAGLAAGTFDPLSVLILTGEPQPTAANAIVAWGRPVDQYAHRASMITKPEVRAIALSKLQLFGAAVLWDVGAASGSVGIEAAQLAPGLRVYSVEQNPDDVARIRANRHQLPVTVVEGKAPQSLTDLPPPDRVFLGGGGIAVFSSCIGRLKPGGVIVATFTTMETALQAVDLLGQNAELLQVSINRGVPVGPQDRLRLEADNPVFLVWGSS